MYSYGQKDGWLPYGTVAETHWQGGTGWGVVVILEFVGQQIFQRYELGLIIVKMLETLHLRTKARKNIHRTFNRLWLKFILNGW